MRLALIADTFPPIQTSGAIQLLALSREFACQGHDVVVIIPTQEHQNPWLLEKTYGVSVLRLKAPKIKDIGYIRRTLGELIMPFIMLRHYNKSPFANQIWDGVVWYSPSIFHAPFVNVLKRRSRCKSYLIIRDIFPEWAVDVGLISHYGLTYQFFNAIARYQYSVANVIGIQASGNSKYFDYWRQQPNHRLEVLQNWLDKRVQVHCPIRICETKLAGRKVFIYAGNMGIAQGMDILLDLVKKMRNREDIGFLFVGRGSEVERLQALSRGWQLNNLLFYDEIKSDEILDLCAQCSAGIVALDSRHRSHNIPGKFLTYMQSGLPVLANVNYGTELAQMIRNEQVGKVCETNQVEDLMRLVDELILQIDEDAGLSARCQSLFEREFTVEKSVRQIVSALSFEINPQAAK